MTDNKTGLDAVVGICPKILILGSLPGDESIRRQQYYSKSGNRFWKIIFGLLGHNFVPNDYQERIKILKEHGIALWDVLSSGVREGSLDSNISEEIPNELSSFLKDNPTIAVIAFNGQKAAKSFEKFFPELVHKNLNKLK
ncbi:MAG: DNA-deoxyinosine glycosylase, partial [Muribaculaceae bacterium]|nr:DNA-deoxyinosine glycosylase [Muribaculaceae bacterium]